MQIVYAKEDFPKSWSSSIFLAGPTPRSPDVPSWRPEALQYLESVGYDGVVFVPESRNGEWDTGTDAYLNQVEWERAGLDAADICLFWVPRNMESMPALTTNVEFGRYITSGKVILGAPEDATSIRYLSTMLASDATGTLHTSLSDTLDAALAQIAKWSKGITTFRQGGETRVPLHIWRLSSFQSWYQAQTTAGNRLDDAKLLWHFYIPKADLVFAWVLWVKVWIANESRWKENEFVLSRLDVSTVVMYLPEPNILDSKIILVREFRSPARTPDGNIHELVGGSSFKPEKDMFQIASSEVYEETGLALESSRFRYIGGRQLAGTLSSHMSHVYVIALTPSEMANAEALAQSSVAHGVVEDTERTYVEVSTFRDILAGQLLDWSNIGMIAQTLLR